jgi:hypothetical protein
MEAFSLSAGKRTKVEGELIMVYCLCFSMVNVFRLTALTSP